MKILKNVQMHDDLPYVRNLKYYEMRDMKRQQLNVALDCFDQSVLRYIYVQVSMMDIDLSFMSLRLLVIVPLERSSQSL